MVNKLSEMCSQLQKLVNKNMSFSKALFHLELQAKSYDDMMVINILRESAEELFMEEQYAA